MIYMILIVIIIIFLITKVEFRIVNKKHKTIMSLRIARVFDFNIDYFKYIKKFITNKYDEDKLSVKEIYENSIKLKDNYPLINKYLETTTLSELSVINRYNDENPYITVANYTLNAFISNFIHNSFGLVKKENYIVSNEDEIDFDFTCIFHTRVVNIIIVSIENAKDFVRLIKKYYRRKIWNIRYINYLTYH